MASAIPVAVGDMTTTRVPGSFSLVYLVFNTIMNVTTQAGQVEVFRNAAAHLEPGGRFLIECGIPDLRRLPYGETAVVFDRTDDHVGVDEYDVANQGLVSHHFTKRGDRWDYGFGSFRYAWPAEMDLMATLAGMRMLDRWRGLGPPPVQEREPVPRLGLGEARLARRVRLGRVSSQIVNGPSLTSSTAISAPNEPVWTSPTPAARSSSAKRGRGARRASGGGGVGEAGAAAARRVGEERELAHDERGAADVEDRAVRPALLVGEDPQLRDAPRERGGRRVVVARGRRRGGRAGPAPIEAIVSSSTATEPRG